LVSAALAVENDILGGHALAVTVDQGTNRYWAWGRNDFGQVGNGTNGANATDPNHPYQYAPAQLQFCTRCQRCVQLGTNGTLYAQCTGTLKLYFNDQIGAFNDNGTNSFTVTVDGFGTTNVPAAAASGVAVGIVTKGSNYTFSASGFCARNEQGDLTDPDGNAPNSNSVSCSSINITNAICPMWRCFSLVGKIQ
jgi:hypothetical protein